MKRFLFVSVFSVLCILSGIFLPKAHAECVPLYGGGQSCTNPSLSLIKSVFNPVTNTYVHDLGINDTHFHPGEKVSFQIVVKNNGDGRATHVIITDSLPSSLLAVAPNPDSTTGPAGATITIQAGDMNPGQQETFTVVGEVATTIPFAVTCQSNQAQVTSHENSTPATDFSQFCVEQTVSPTSTLVTATPTPLAQTQTAPTVFPPTPTTTLPPTGPEALPLLALFPTGITGFVLRKWANKNRDKRGK